MVGYTSFHAPVIAVTVSGALTYQQSAEIMKNIGCEGAIMLDGGSSTSMYEKNNGMLKNSAIYRQIANAIVISNK